MQRNLLSPKAILRIGSGVGSKTMRRDELEQSKITLLALMREMEQPRHDREEITVENPADTVERVQRANEREMAIRRIETGFNRLQSVKLALERVADGSYGVCLRCDGEIGGKRLTALPWAAHCVKCQEAVDREIKEQNPEEALRAL